jgi:hypothetical protein
MKFLDTVNSGDIGDIRRSFLSSRNARCFTTSGIGFFVTSETRRAFEKQLAGYKTASSSVQFPLDKPLPAALIRRMVRARVAALKTRDAKWRTPD